MLSDGSAREFWTIHGKPGRLGVLTFSNGRRLCNVCDDRGGDVSMRVDERARLWLLEDDDAQTLSSQPSRLAMPRSEGGVIHRRAELV